MLEMYSTPLDVLYLILSIFIALVGIFLVLALFHLVKILGNVNKVTSKAKDTMDLVNHYLWQPIKIALMILEKVKTASGSKKSKGE
jgi:hypothetical protein